MTRLCAQAGTDASGRKLCSHIWLAQMLNCNTKQTFFKKSWDALELARLQEFMCPRWRAELKLVSAPAYLRVWLPILPASVLKEFGEIFRTRPNLVRPWASRMQHIYGAITHQFDSIFSVEGRNGARLLVYQDRDVKQLNVFWPLYYFGQGEQQDQLYMDKLEYMETRVQSARAMSQAGRERLFLAVLGERKIRRIATVMQKGAAIAIVTCNGSVGVSAPGNVNATATKRNVAPASFSRSGGACSATVICIGYIAGS